MKKEIVITIFLLCFFSFSALAAPPFFLMGDGKLKIKNVHNGQQTEVNYMNQNGSLNKEAFQKIDIVFGFPTTDKGENISQRLIAMLDYFVDLVAPNQTIMLTSGYRSPEYNQGLRNKGRVAAKTSTHIDGMALDFYLPGRNATQAKALWDTIRAKNCCGTGHYGGQNVHLDVAKPRFWQQSTSKVHTDASAHNKFIYYSTEYDFYQQGAALRSFFASVSDFGFGIQNQVVFVTDDETQTPVMTAKIDTDNPAECLMIQDRKQSRFIFTHIPQQIKPGRYRIKIIFCERPFEDMPEFSVSNPVKIVGKEL